MLVTLVSHYLDVAVEMEVAGNSGNIEVEGAGNCDDIEVEVAVNLGDFGLEAADTIMLERSLDDCTEKQLLAGPAYQIETHRQ